MITIDRKPLWLVCMLNIRHAELISKTVEEKKRVIDDHIEMAKATLYDIIKEND